MWAGVFAIMILAVAIVWWRSNGEEVASPLVDVAAQPPPSAPGPLGSVLPSDSGLGDAGPLRTASDDVIDPRSAVSPTPTVAKSEPADDDADWCVALARCGADAGNREWTWRVRDQVERWRYGNEESPDLSGRDFRDADLQRVNMANADLRGANLAGAALNEADLHGADLRGADFHKTDLSSADLRDAQLRGTDLRFALVFGTDLRGADLRDARIACRDCGTHTGMFSNLFGADLRGADFGRARIDDSIFEDADLRGANFADTRGVPMSMRGAVYNHDTVLPVGIDPDIWEMAYRP